MNTLTIMGVLVIVLVVTVAIIVIFARQSASELPKGKSLDKMNAKELKRYRSNRGRY